jgi:hypothetical protein
MTERPPSAEPGLCQVKHQNPPGALSDICTSVIAQDALKSGTRQEDLDLNKEK